MSYSNGEPQTEKRNFKSELEGIQIKQDESKIKTGIDRFGDIVPQLVNMVEGGKTPLKPAIELEKLGFSIVIFPGALVRVLAHAADQYFASLREHGSTIQYLDNMFDFDELNDLLGTEKMLEMGEKYKDGGG